MDKFAVSPARRARARLSIIGPAALGGCLALLSPPCVPAAPLTEDEAVRIALERPALREAIDGTLNLAESDLAEAALPPNPGVEYAQERLSADRVEHALLLSQSFDLAGRRALRRDAAGLRVEAARADGAARRVALAAEVRRVFYQGLHRELRLAALDAWAARIAAAEAVVTRLAAAGEASGYDRRRIARERLGAEAQQATLRAERDRTLGRLQALLGESSPRAPAGSLPPAPPPPRADLATRLEQRPDLQRLRLEAGAWAKEREAARRSAVPEVTLGVGPRYVEEPDGEDWGLVFSVSMPLPVYDRGQAATARAGARERIALAEQRLALERAEGEMHAARRQAAAMAEAALRFRGEALAASQRLADIAATAYRAGEGGILELLDAQRALLDAETTALDMELAARLARIELDEIIGGPPQ